MSYGIGRIDVPGSFKQVMADSGGVYFAMAIATLAIGAAAEVSPIALPVLVWTFGPLVAGMITGQHGMSVAPLPIGAEWVSLSRTPGVVDLWLGACIDTMLVLAPAFAFLPACALPAVRLDRMAPLASQIAATGFGLFGLLLLVELPRMNGAGGSGFLTDLVPLAALFAFGAALDERWRGRWPIVLGVAVLATNDFMQWAVIRGSLTRRLTSDTS